MVMSTGRMEWRHFELGMACHAAEPALWPRMVTIRLHSCYTQVTLRLDLGYTSVIAPPYLRGDKGAMARLIRRDD